MTEELDDETLVSRVASGDRTAYAALVHRHGLRYRALACRFVSDVALAEDLVQDAFVKLWTHADRFDADKAKFTTWFHRIVVNRCLDEKRKRRPEPLPEGFDLPDSTPSVEARMAADDNSGDLARALAALPERQRTAVTLSYLDGLSNKQAAEVLDMNIKAFESLLVRARAKLRAELAGKAPQLFSAYG